MEIKNLSKDAKDFTGNVWLLDSNGEKVLIDVGTGDSWNAIRELESVDKVVITHSHSDHTGNLKKVSEKFNPEVFAYNPENISVESQKVEEGDILSLGGTRFQVYHTPGHKNDSICLYSPEEKVLFTGDLIFPDGKFGRTDLKEGDRDRLIRSIEKITELEPEEMYPGHERAVKEDLVPQIRKSLENAEKKEPKY